MDRPQRGKRTEKGVSPFSFSLSMHYQVIHHTPGRLRVRSGRCAFNHDQAYGIECRLLKQKGVYSVKATPCNGGVFILYERTNPQAIFRTLDRLRPETLRSHEPEERAEARKLARSFFLRIAGKASSFLFCKVFLPPPLRIAKAFWNYGSYLRRGMAGLGSGRLNVAVLDAVSIGVSIGTKAYGTANSIMFLLSISDLLENYTRKKTRAALAASLSINIDRVWRVEEGGMRQVPMEQIRPGEKIRVDAGNVIPVDGTVLSGEAEVNQAAMTGESEAASKREGAVVFAGTTLETGSLVIRVDAAGDQSRINNIIALIDHSEELKARIQSRAEKLADSIVPYTLLTAGALFLFTRNISKALSVLMVDYSCAIKLATPISVISAMKEAAARK
ncbi:HAD-IC family P-type ATPase, partial [Akkermansia muciniphila]|uniref:HAD-IC family P-type ATPase n=1 Tax=Akkermansia muciniphila TaxID=239935 RepID=UPI00319E5E36